MLVILRLGPPWKPLMSTQPTDRLFMCLNGDIISLSEPLNITNSTFSPHNRFLSLSPWALIVVHHQRHTLVNVL